MAFQSIMKSGLMVRMRRPEKICPSISDVMDYMLPVHEEFGFQCRRLLHMLQKVGRMSILIMWASKLKESKKIMIYPYLKKERLI